MRRKILITLSILFVAVGIYFITHQNKKVDGGGNQVTHLEVMELKKGEKGPEVKIGHQVTIDYTAWRWDGRMFDSSYDHKKPMIFRVGAGTAFTGLQQGVMGMKVGGKRKLTIPPDMATGVNGTGGSIPQNAALIYEIELKKIE